MSVVLIIGGAGYIGSVLFEKLLESDTDMTIVLDRFSHGTEHLNLISKKVSSMKYKLIKNDIRNKKELAEALKGVDIVIHLASIVGAKDCSMKPKEALEVNVNAVKNIADSAVKNDVKCIVFASTCSVYGLQSNNLFVDEKTRPNPTSSYDLTKLEAENILQSAHKKYGLDTRILRLSTVYGPSPAMRFNIFPNAFVLQACRNKRITLFGGNAWRPLLYTYDTAQGFILASKAPASKASGETFNLGSNFENYTIEQVAEIVSQEVEGTKILKESTKSVPRSYRVNCNKIKNVLAFSPQYTLRKGVRELQNLIDKGLLKN